MIPAPGVGLGSEKNLEDPTGGNEASAEPKRKKRVLTLGPNRRVFLIENRMCKAWRCGTMCCVLVNSGWLEARSRRKLQEVSRTARQGKPSGAVWTWLPR